MPRPQKLPSLRLLFSLTLGVLALWGVVVMLVFMWAATQQMGFSITTYYENLRVDATGQLVIEAYSTAGGVYRTLPRRDIHGKEIDSPQPSLLQPATLYSGRVPRSWLLGPINWGERLMSTQSRGLQYLVRDAAPQGRAYVVGYEKRWRLPTQYAGRDGFHPTPRDATQQFDVGGPFGATSQRVVGVEWNGGRYYPSRGEDTSATPKSALFLLDGDNLTEINFLSSTVRTLMKTEDALSLAVVQQPLADDSPNKKWTSEGDVVTIAEGDVITIESPTETRLALRTHTRIFIIDPRQADQIEFKLPADLRTAEFDICALNPKEILIDRAERNSGGEFEHHLTWIEAGNDAVRTETITTRGYPPQHMRLEATIAGAVLPMLPLYLPITLLFIPKTLLQTAAAVTYEGALWQTGYAIWPAALGLAILSLIAAYLVLRWERKHGRPHPWRWAIATFLLGVPGFIAYILLHGRKPLAAPRRERPATPALLGTELFA